MSGRSEPWIIVDEVVLIEAGGSAPASAALLVAWSELPPGASTHRIRIARLQCDGLP